MALFKIFKGQSSGLPKTYKDGYCYFTTDDGKMYIDTKDSDSTGRICLNAAKADSATKDNKGNIISSTYLPLSGGTMTGNITMNNNSKTTYNLTIKNDYTVNSPTEQPITINAGLASGIELTDRNAPGVGFHVGNTTWGNLILTKSGFKFINNTRDGLMSVYASRLYGNVTGNLTGNADTASKLATTRNIALTGDVTGNVNFDGSGNVSITTTNKHGLLHSNFTTVIPENTTSGGWELIDSSYNKSGFFLKSIRTCSVAPTWILGNCASGIAFGGYDTKGVMSVAYHSPQVKFAGGNGMTPVWNFQINATSGQTYTFPSAGGTVALTTSNITGNAATATVASYLNIAGYGTDNVNRYVFFAHSNDNVSSGQSRVVADEEFKYNPATNVLTVGSITGSASKWTTARTISIAQTAGTTGTALDGSQNVSLILPTTIAGFTHIDTKKLVIDTNTSSENQGLFVTRNGTVARECLRVGITDSQAQFIYSNDEVSSGFLFRMINTGEENNNQTNANSADVVFQCSNGQSHVGATFFNGTLNGSATKLTTARNIRTNLASTSTASFDGSADITPGVTGTLPITNGGTGVNTHTTNRLVWSISSTQIQGGYHYASTSKIGVNLTTEPTTNFYVNGSAAFSGSVIANSDLSIGGSLTVNTNKSNGLVSLFEDGEGGTIVLRSKNGTYQYHIDAYNDETIRIHTADLNPNGSYQQMSWNGKTGELIATKFTGPLNGNATTASTLQTARTISLTGDVTGSVSFNGGSNVSITTTVADNSHNHNRTVSNGTHAEAASSTNATTPTEGMLHTNGLYMTQNYGDSTTPCSYGNIINVAGAGTNQIFCEWKGTDSTSGGIWYRSHRDTSTGGWGAWRQVWLSGDTVRGAVWNDYAECRESHDTEPGYVLMEVGDDSLTKTIERLSHFAGISSDTYGFSQGETDKAKTPIAVAGRVLAYPYQDRDNYKPGDCVCAAPGGTVDIMTREEIINWPDRIVGTVSCVPDYEEWGGGEIADRPAVKVNGRIWIKVK